MKLKSTFSNLLAAALVPVIFACAHNSPTEELMDGYADLSDLTPVLSEPTELDAFLADPHLTEVAAAPEPSDTQIAQAQRKIAAAASKPKQIKSPFQNPVAKSKPQPEAKASIPPEVVEDKEPPTTVVRNGSVLNRYYFVRAGDTPERLSSLFYQTPDRAAELVEWNGPALGWTPGTTLYYRSSSSPDDDQLLSYYFEAGVPTEDVFPESGDTLKSLAKRRFGSADSWREIAALNGLSDSEQPEPGSVLRVYPFPLSQDPTAQRLADNGPKAPKEPKLASTQFGSFLHHNPLLVACSLVALVLLLGYFVLQRRRYRSRFDF